MTVIAAAFFGVLALSPVWLAWWVRRHPRPLRKPGAAWVGLSVTIATCWLGVMGFYLFFVRTDTASGGHPLAAIITLVVLALAVVLGITGSTILWRAERSAQTRNAALGLATGRRWWPNWLALLGCVILAPALVMIAGVALTAIVDSASATPLTTDQVNSYTFPTIAIAGIVMIAGLVYFYVLRDGLKSREAERLRRWNQDYLDNRQGDDQPEPG